MSERGDYQYLRVGKDKVARCSCRNPSEWCDRKTCGLRVVANELIPKGARIWRPTIAYPDDIPSSPSHTRGEQKP